MNRSWTVNFFRRNIHIQIFDYSLLSDSLLVEHILIPQIIAAMSAFAPKPAVA